MDGERVEASDFPETEVGSVVDQLGNHERGNYAVPADSQGEQAGGYGCRGPHRGSNARGDAEEQGRQGGHQEPRGRTEAEFPARVDAIRNRGDRVQGGDHRQAPVSGAHQRQQAGNGDEKGGGVVDQSLGTVEPVAGQRHQPGRRVQGVLVPGVAGAKRSHPVAAVGEVVGQDSSKGGAAGGGYREHGGLSPDAEEGLQGDESPQQHAEGRVARVKENQACRDQGQERQQDGLRGQAGVAPSWKEPVAEQQQCEKRRQEGGDFGVQLGAVEEKRGRRGCRGDARQGREAGEPQAHEPKVGEPAGGRGQQVREQDAGQPRIGPELQPGPIGGNEQEGEPDRMHGVDLSRG